MHEWLDSIVKFLGTVKKLIGLSRGADSFANFLISFRTKLGIERDPAVIIKEKTANFFKKWPNLKRALDICGEGLGYAYGIFTSIRTLRLVAVISTFAIFSAASAGVMPLVILATSVASMLIQASIDAYRVMKLETKAKESKLLQQYIDAKAKAIEQYRELGQEHPGIKDLLVDAEKIVRAEDINKDTILSRIDRKSLVAEITRLQDSQIPEDKNRIIVLRRKLQEIEDKFGVIGSKGGFVTCMKASAWGLVTGACETSVFLVNMGLVVSNPIAAITLGAAAMGNYIGTTSLIYNNERSIKQYQRDIKQAKERRDIPAYNSLEELKSIVRKMEVIGGKLEEAVRNKSLLDAGKLVQAHNAIEMKAKFAPKLQEFFKDFLREFNPFAKSFVAHGSEIKIKAKYQSSLDLDKENKAKMIAEFTTKFEEKKKLSKEDFQAVNTTTKAISTLGRLAQARIGNNPLGYFVVSLCDLVANSFSAITIAVKRRSLKTGAKKAETKEREAVIENIGSVSTLASRQRTEGVIASSPKKEQVSTIVEVPNPQSPTNKRGA